MLRGRAGPGRRLGRGRRSPKASGRSAARSGRAVPARRGLAPRRYGFTALPAANVCTRGPRRVAHQGAGAPARRRPRGRAFRGRRRRGLRRRSQRLGDRDQGAPRQASIAGDPAADPGSCDSRAALLRSPHLARSRDPRRQLSPGHTGIRSSGLLVAWAQAEDLDLLTNESEVFSAYGVRVLRQNQLTRPLFVPYEGSAMRSRTERWRGGLRRRDPRSTAGNHGRESWPESSARRAPSPCW